jgi:hypothetical protein
MELIDVIAKAHFENPNLGAVARKQRLRIGKPLAEYLVGLELVDYANPPKAVVTESPKTEAADLGGDEPSTSSQPDQASQEETVSTSRRGRRRKTGEYSQ